jgi:hypothetical protein
MSRPNMYVLNSGVPFHMSLSTEAVPADAGFLHDKACLALGRDKRDILLL